MERLLPGGHLTSVRYVCGNTNGIWPLFLNSLAVIVLILNIIKTSVCLYLGCDQTSIRFIYSAISKKMIKILSPILSVKLSPCHCHPLSKPWQGADCHLSPLMHVDLPAAAFHLTVGILTWRVLTHMEVPAISPHHLPLFWAMTEWAIYTSLFWIIICPPVLGFPTWWSQALATSV